MWVCWYCYWGWPKVVANIYTEAKLRLNGDSTPLNFGPSHIVWEDENFESAELCLSHFNKGNCDFTKEELEIVRWSLEELSKVPLKDRCVEPDDYNGSNPQFYPPPKNIEMVKV